MSEISSKHYFPKYSLFVFMALYVVLAMVYGYQNTLFELPQSIHQWRQADCLSLATNYYEDQNPFLEPSVHYLGRDGTGKTISEFPIIYYAVAKIWTLTGRNIWVYRSLIAIIFFLGLTALFKLVEREVENSYAGLFVGLLMFTSPVLVYYSNNFLMNIPALALAMIGLYFFYTFRHTKHTKHLMWSCLFYTLAALLKVSALLSFIAIIIVLVLENLPIKFSIQKIFRLNYKSILALLAVFIIPFLWYKYAVHYNNQHTGGIFLIGILPIWKMTLIEIKETWRYILIHMRLDYFRPFIEITFAIIAVITIVLHRRVQRLTSRLLILVGLGIVGFCLLFFKALQWHDYYTIDLYILIPILLLAFFTAFRSKYIKAFYSFITPLVLLALLIHSADFARRRILERYDINGYRNLHHRDMFQAFSEIDPLLKELNITRQDKVLSLSDYSINITLYLMDRKGWTDYGVGMNPDRIEEKIEQGAKYLFIADKKTLENPVLTPYIQNKIGSYKNISIFDLSKPLN